MREKKKPCRLCGSPERAKGYNICLACMGNIFGQEDYNEGEQN
jgi:hypothetical protein